jgi:transposase
MERRLRYGAIVVDLERGKPIALLAERSQATVTRWLKQHPTIKIVARDRSKEFAAAITAALPQAQQAADRWHLAKNLTEQLDKVVATRWKALTKAWRPAETKAAPVPAALAEQLETPSLGEARYQQALSLAQAGAPAKQISQRLGVSHQTIYRWLAQEQGPHTGPRRPRRSPLEWITAALHERWEAGERDGRVLWEDLKRQGYRGSLRSVYRRLERWRAGPRRWSSSTFTRDLPPSPWEEVTPGKIVGWIIARAETLHPEDQTRLEQLCERDSTLADARALAQRWFGFIRAHSCAGLESWLKDMRSSSIPAFVSFARSVERDKTAIVAGLTLPYSTGPAEGHITRLKLIKRQAYGRASLAYLQRRFLPVA